MLKICWVMLAVLVAGGIIGYSSEREPSKDHSIKVWSLLARQFQRRRFVNIFPIRSYVKIMSADIGSLGWRAGSSDAIRKRGPLKDHSNKVWS